MINNIDNLIVITSEQQVSDAIGRYFKIRHDVNNILSLTFKDFRDTEKRLALGNSFEGNVLLISEIYEVIFHNNGYDLESRLEFIRHVFKYSHLILLDFNVNGTKDMNHFNYVLRIPFLIKDLIKNAKKISSDEFTELIRNFTSTTPKSHG